jgi:condensin complex subunit 2
MAYVQSKVMKKRLQDKRRVSGAALLREELNVSTGDTSSLLDSLPVEKDKGVMLANFEEWIKMATDNKINTTNSWNFALIDYFHDMDVLRGKDNNINFQKASATLDGCVKIYSSRVDSVATETGRLLSGLATRKEDSPVGGENNDEDDEDPNHSDDEEEGTATSSKKKKSMKTRVRDTGDTLTTFEQIKIKKLSQELSIDPLFKKTLAEFDEGGAKSLLLNTLHIDDRSRVVFDASTTNPNDAQDEEVKDEIKDEDVEMTDMDDMVIDLSSLQNFLYTDIAELDEKSLCPSMEHLNSVLKDINKAKSILNGFTEQQQEFSKMGGDMENKSDVLNNYADEYDPEFNDNSYGELNNEAAAVIFQDELRPDQEEVGNETGIVASVVDQDLMAYFDNTLKRNWAGPEHWKVRQFKRDKGQSLQVATTPGVKQKKVKEVFTIDFISPMDEELEDKMFAKGKGSIVLPQSEREDRDNHLLPDDMYFSSDQLTRLFLKPDQKLNIFRKKVNVRSVAGSQEPEGERQPDATFWADNYKERDEPQGAEYVVDPFYDDGDGFDDNGQDLDFDMGSMPTEEKASFGTQLITGGAKVKSEYVNYSKRAKNVNVKQLKDNIWKSIEVKKDEPVMQFSDLVNDITRMYPKEQKKDLSTSFCFICLLHLANEHSLTIENNEALDDLQVTGYKK